MTDPKLIIPHLGAGQTLPVKKGKYTRQVIWCLDSTDPATSKTAKNLQGKRMAAGDGGLSQIVWGLNSGWPTPFPIDKPGNNIRLYVVAHGVELIRRGPAGVTYDTLIQVRPEGTPNSSITVDDFFRILKAFIDGSPSKNVRRISLAMCISGGIRGKIPPERSFAKKLADMSADLTDDITGRAGDVNLQHHAFTKSDADDIFKGKQNPLLTIKVGSADASLVNTWKLVDGRKDFATYIFEPFSPPVLKPGYTEV